MILDPLFWNGPGLTSGRSVKPVAMAYRGWTRLLGHADRHGLLDAYEYPSMRGRTHKAHVDSKGAANNTKHTKF